MSRTFNGTTDLISLGSPTALDDVGGVNGQRFVSAWIYPTGWGEGNFGRIWDKGTFSSTGWFFFLKNDAAPLATLAGVVGASTSAAVANAVGSTITLNQWRFVAMTWAGTIGTNSPKLFVGSLSSPVAEVSYDASTFVGTGTQGSDAAQTAYIGNRGAADRTFAGRIEHLTVGDKALSAEQLDRLRVMPYAPMHRFSVGGSVCTIKGYYPLWESSASVCIDHSGNGNNGTVTGTTVDVAAPFGWTRSRTGRVLIPAAAGTSLTPTVGAAVLSGLSPARVVGTILTPVTP